MSDEHGNVMLVDDRNRVVDACHIDDQGTVTPRPELVDPPDDDDDVDGGMVVAVGIIFVVVIGLTLFAALMLRIVFP